MQFLKTLFASCLGVLLALGVIVTGIMGLGLMMGDGDKVSLKDNTVLELTFDKAMPEKTDNLERDALSLDASNVLGLQEMTELLAHAKEDAKIKGIVLRPDAVPTGMAGASVLRRSLEDFRKSGKFVIAYSDSYSNGTYYLASAADKIYIHPLGRLDFRGFASVIPFFKDMLDRLGINPQVYYAGQFKSATEPFRLNKMSDPNRLQVREYLEGLYSIYLDDISRTRKVSAEQLRNIANNYTADDPRGAIQQGLIDTIGLISDVQADLRKRMSLKEDDKINKISPEDYAKTYSRKLNATAKDKIAVVYAEGNIINSDDDAEGSIAQAKYVKIIQEIRRDDKVKAIVLRVNSGGGDAVTSESILQELKLAQKEGKKVIVSMGDYAASGGYYIACAADSIFAEPNTITGSIGVFTMMFSLEKMLNNKLGVHYDTVTTGSPYATMMVPFFDKNAKQGAQIQEFVDTLYETFLDRVATGRGLSRDSVHSIAQGRVWTGTKAKQIGLVDALGDLNAAMAAAAGMTGLKTYRTVEYPKIKDPVTQLVEQLTGQKSAEKAKAEAIRTELGPLYSYYNDLRTIGRLQGAQMMLMHRPEW